MISQSLDDQTALLSLEHAFTKYIADSVGQNSATLYRKGTFHVMGIIATMVTSQR